MSNLAKSNNRFSRRLVGQCCHPARSANLSDEQIKCCYPIFRAWTLLAAAITVGMTIERMTTQARDEVIQGARPSTLFIKQHGSVLRVVSETAVHGNRENQG
jgi:hypothetical protein